MSTSRRVSKSQAKIVVANKNYTFDECANSDERRILYYVDTYINTHYT